MHVSLACFVLSQELKKRKENVQAAVAKAKKSIALESPAQLHTGTRLHEHQAVNCG